MVIIISTNDNNKNTVHGRNPAPVEGKVVVVYPIIYKGFIHFRWFEIAGFLFTIKQ